jgi:hypothetical protein
LPGIGLSVKEPFQFDWRLVETQDGRFHGDRLRPGMMAARCAS